jgi:hypothetical protein
MARPVSVETLASIPWMSGKRVSHCMREVSLRGPDSVDVWRKLLGRADMIAHSLNPKQTGLILNALARVRRRDLKELDPFMTRFTARFLPNILTHANPIDIAQILHAYSELGYEVPNMDTVNGRLAECIPTMDAPTVSLLTSGLSGSHKLFTLILTRSVQLLKIEFNEQLFAQSFKVIHDTPPSMEFLAITAQHVPTMSLRCLVLTVSGLGRCGTRNPELIDIISERIASIDFTLKQLGVLLRGLQKMDAMKTHPDLCYKLAERIVARDSVDSSTMSVLLAGLVRIQNTNGKIEKLFDMNPLPEKVRKADIPHFRAISASLARVVDSPKMAAYRKTIFELIDGQ